MKRLALIFCVFVCMCMALFALASCSGGDHDDLYVYNWGEYISDGSEDSVNVTEEFEKYYEELTGRSMKVHYTTYPSNEDMYAKISSGTSNYDVIIPSDYMIERLITEGLLAEIDIEAVCEKYGAECYYEYIGDNYRRLFYDPEDKYSVPYTYGRVGIIYNTTMVDEEDLGGWELMWNDKYAGKILQFNNSRDGFATAQYMLDLDVNSTDPDVWRRAQEEMLRQKPIIQSYVMDEIYNKMESGEAAISAYYAGDYFTMLDVNEDLGFYYPERTNVFVDAMCVPKSSSNKEAAQLFINFMLSEDIAIANAEYIYYASPNSLVFENEDYIEEMGEEAMEILYPEGFNFAEELNTYAYRNLDGGTLELMNSLWEDMKITGGLPTYVYMTAIVLAVAIAAAITVVAVRRKRRAKWY